MTSASSVKNCSTPAHLGRKANESSRREKYPQRLNRNPSTSGQWVERFASLSIMERRELQDEGVLLEKFRHEIRLHHNDRLTAFFYTAVAVYLTQNVYSIGPTIEQAVSAKELKGVCKLNACHSKIVPTLVVDGRIFLPGSDHFKISNRTNDLPRVVNEADMKLESQQRSPAISIFNEVSQNKLTPRKATRKFIRETTETLLKSKDNACLRIYCEVNQSIEKELRLDDFLLLLGLKVNHERDESHIYHKRIKAIQRNLVLQVKIFKIFKTVKGGSRNKAFFQDALMYKLIELIDKCDRVRLQKYFAIPPREFYFPDENESIAQGKEVYSGQDKSRFTRLKNTMDALDREDIKDSAEKISELMATERKYDRVEQEELMVELRGKENLPKEINDDSIRKWCKEFDVDESAFFPQFFYS